MTGTEPGPPPAAPPMSCPRCGAPIEGGQSWCLECGLAARTRLARTPRWRAPLVIAGVVGLAAMVALVVAFLVLTGDNAPLPTTVPAATTAPPVDTAPSTVSIPTATTPAATAPTPAPATPVPTTSVPAVTAPTTPATTATAP